MQIKVLYKLPNNRYIGYALLVSGWLLLSGIIVLPFFAFLLGEGVIVVTILALIPTMILFNALTDHGRRILAKDAENQLRQDLRPPIIYLRSFAEDGKLSPLASRRINKPSFNVWKLNSYEERIALALRNLGPFVAIGNPHEELPTLGAARMYVNDSDWHEKVIEAMSKATLVLLRVGYSEGLLWELRQAVATVQPEHIILCFPETYQQDFYHKFYSKSFSLFPHPLPAEIGNAHFLYFDNEWQPHLITANNAESVLRTFPTDVDLLTTQQLALKNLCSEFASSGAGACLLIIAGYIFLALVLLALYFLYTL